MIRKSAVWLALGVLALAAETYTDPKTGLMWQDDRDAYDRELTWHLAVNYCGNLRLDGYSDWRLPTVRELYTLIDLAREDPAAVKALRFAASEDYWSASQVVGDRDDAWLVYFEDGVVNHYSKTRERNVRCVRDAGAENSRPR